MTDLRITTTGLDQLAARFKNADDVIGRELVTMVNRLTIAGSTESKRAVGVDTGTLRRSLTHEPATFAGGVARGRWGTNVPYAKWHNDGTRPHVILPKGKALAWQGSGVFGPVLRGFSGKRGGGMIFAARVNHPGTKGRKYMEAGAALVRKRAAAEGRAAAARIVAALT
jgi:hypothetical protein